MINNNIKLQHQTRSSQTIASAFCSCSHTFVLLTLHLNHHITAQLADSALKFFIIILIFIFWTTLPKWNYKREASDVNACLQFFLMTAFVLGKAVKTIEAFLLSSFNSFRQELSSYLFL